MVTPWPSVTFGGAVVLVSLSVCETVSKKPSDGKEVVFTPEDRIPLPSKGSKFQNSQHFHLQWYRQNSWIGRKGIESHRDWGKTPRDWRWTGITSLFPSAKCPQSVRKVSTLPESATLSGVRVYGRVVRRLGLFTGSLSARHLLAVKTWNSDPNQSFFSSFLKSSKEWKRSSRPRTRCHCLQINTNSKFTSLSSAMTSSKTLIGRKRTESHPNPYTIRTQAMSAKIVSHSVDSDDTTPTMSANSKSAMSGSHERVNNVLTQLRHKKNGSCFGRKESKVRSNKLLLPFYLTVNSFEKIV